MEETILEAETELERLEAVTTDPATIADHRKAAEAFAALTAAQDRVRNLYARWSELEDLQASGD